MAPKLLFGLLLFNALTVALRFYLSHYNLFHSGCSWADPTAEIKLAAFGDPQITGTSAGTSYRKRLDVFGNDHYLGHVYNTVIKRLVPSHVAVMGDLISSQWIDDLEFYQRARRYRQWIFNNRDGIEFFNISGNHDIGYGGEMNMERVNRYEAVYGNLNFEVVYHFGDEKLPYRVVGINSLALDGPNFDPQYEREVKEFMQKLWEQQFRGATILLTHIPLHKPSGICRDGPHFKYYEWGTIKEQNHLTKDSSELVLKTFFQQGNKYGGVVLTGHDHEGCDSVYSKNFDETWEVQSGRQGWQEYSSSGQDAIVSEHTVRSMMGEYGGNTGLLTGKFNASTQRWDFYYTVCPFVVQHLWWVSKVATYVTLGLDSLVLVWRMLA